MVEAYNSGRDARNQPAETADGAPRDARSVRRDPTGHSPRCALRPSRPDRSLPTMRASSVETLKVSDPDTDTHW